MWHTIIFLGNLGRDPEMRYIPSGKPVTSFPVAVSRKYTSNSGQSVEETIWIRVSVWDKQAENCNQYLKKGSKVLIEGRLSPDPVTGGPKTYTKKDGTTGASYEVTASLVRFLSPKSESTSGGEEAGDFGGHPAVDEDAIPF
ncbi:MAG TPA: single-stranded DNA-binding protein [Anaerolineaceae bacterium]|jgi:single-strand DNA-binding protein